MVGKIRDSFSKLPASQMLDTLIDKAIESQASYIHIEPYDSDVLVRYRVNGSLIEINRFSKKRLDSLVERVKNLANLETKIRNIPQDGKFRISSAESAYTLRVSILPTIGGEKISINILNSSKISPSLVELGYWGHSLQAIENALKQTKGLILLVGPRDTGKSLSLLSMLSTINDNQRKIATIEDPVEYVIPGANQIQVNERTNLTYVNGINALQNHDNDILMISEIRDSETAKLVYQIASRGKLVLSSIYAEHFYGALSKLNDAGVSHSLIAHVTKIICTQRLVRRLCTTCRESYEPDKATLNLIDHTFDLVNPRKMKQLHDLENLYVSQFSDKPINSKDLNTTDTRIKKLWRPHNGGCEKCLHTGYLGRVGLYEVIDVNSDIEKLILSLASAKVILNKATSDGTVSLFIDGLIKALQGITSINEIFRISQEQF